MLRFAIGGVVAGHVLHPMLGMAIGSPKLVSAMELDSFDGPSRLGSTRALLLDVGALGGAHISSSIPIWGQHRAAVTRGPP